MVVARNWGGERDSYSVGTELKYRKRSRDLLYNNAHRASNTVIYS